MAPLEMFHASVDDDRACAAIESMDGPLGPSRRGAILRPRFSHAREARLQRAEGSAFDPQGSSATLLGGTAVL
jgi:hypothetical protein